jgi:cyclic beta-1,2-glucan synthetase
MPLMERRDFRSRGGPAAWWVAAALVLLALPADARCAADDRPVRLTDAVERGTFTIGAARATVSPVFDPLAVTPALQVEYTLPRGTAAGVWAKAFPVRLDADTADVVRVRVWGANAGQIGQITATLEIKGTAGGIQRIPLDLRPTRRPAESEIDWTAIGTLGEVVVAISRTGDDESIAGRLSIDVSFHRRSWLRKLSEHPDARIGGNVLAGLLGMLLAALLQRLWSTSGARTEVGGLRRDIVYGVAAVGIAVLVAAIYLMRQRSQLEAGWDSVGAAVAGAALGEWLKFGLAGRHLTGVEAFCDMLATGLPAASASSLAVLQTPVNWPEALLLSGPTAATVVLIYHMANACRISSNGRHLSAMSTALIVGTPYAVGGLLLLRSDALLQSTFGNVFAARVLVVFLFNEIVANALSAATGRGPVRSIRAHAVMLAVAAVVIAAPEIAAKGSSKTVASLPEWLRLVVAVATAILSQAGLWAEVYLITGMLMDAIHGRAPSGASTWDHCTEGVIKGAIFSGAFMAVLYVPGMLWGQREVREIVKSQPVIVAVLLGALVFPLVKTVIESFDGSPPFFRRLAKNYRHPVLYCRGAVVGFGVAVAISMSLPQAETPRRAEIGFLFGAVAYAGVNFVRDCLYASQGHGRVQSWRVYFVHSMLGGCIGAAIAFYFDAPQVTAVREKFLAYLAMGRKPVPFGVRPLLSKWGSIDLGTVTGGPSLFFAESLSGVIEWSIPAWLFALNRTFLSAYFRKEAGPIKSLFTRDGMIGLTDNMLAVFRWGLWMSPIIKSCLRPMGEPTWYNQDGLIRTLIATVQDVRLSPEQFRAWSLDVFIALLVYDSVRILIWLDHMGLRVATLVNLSFLGMDKLEQRLSRFLAPTATARCIPEAVKRFTTWAPLIIPYYLPRNKDWDYAWDKSQEMIRASTDGGILATIVALQPAKQVLLLAVAVVSSTASFVAIRRLRSRSVRRQSEYSLSNAVYEVVVKANGEVYSQARDRGYDVSRRSYDRLDPAGRTVFVVDVAGERLRAWPLVGNYPADVGAAPRIAADERSIKVSDTRERLRTTIEISLPSASDATELWTITIENSADAARPIKLVPYLEWVLNRPDADRGHTQYNRLFAEMGFNRELHAILAWDKHSKAMGFLAADVAPEGFLSYRMDFIGRGRSVWTPRVLETLAFRHGEDTPAHPTLDPIGSLLLSATVPARGKVTVRLLIGMTNDRQGAIERIARYISSPSSVAASISPRERLSRGLKPAATEEGQGRASIGHGEIPSGTPQPYSEFSEDGRTLAVNTPFTPRPIDHVLSNALGHVVAVTNRGPYTTSNVNSQQNRLTPDWPDIVTREVPAEAFYLYDADRRLWFSPTYHPVNDPDALHQAEFGVDGTATYHMLHAELQTDLTVFVPPNEPAGVYLLTVRNPGNTPRRLRLAPFFQMVLAGQPEYAGPLKIWREEELNAVFFENPRNTFRTGPAFVAMSHAAERVETDRGRFFGPGRSVARPTFVARGEPAVDAADDRPIAAVLATLDLPAHGSSSVVVLLGQADNEEQAKAVINRLRQPDAARAALDQTRRWWLSLLDNVRVETSNPEFDRYLDWLKYQALAERIWARRGFYQASGAFGYRDQLQDSINLIWMDPAIARRQLLLHGSQQFLEGDVVHWFHVLQDGRTGFVGRTHASDNLLWLPWGLVEYVGATGDESILDERTAYLESEQPFPPLPANKHGMGFDPLRSPREDTTYRHCLRAIDLLLDKKMGAHGLPLIGTGDWNDGLDEIGSQGRGESIWLGFFLYYILERMAPIVGRRDGERREAYYRDRLRQLGEALEGTWREDRYLRAINDDGIEIGVKGSGIWEIDALTAAWAVMTGLNPARGRIVFDTALGILEKQTTILLGWPPLREDSKPYLGRSSAYPEGVRENGMYCHGVQWLVGAARILAEQCERDGNADDARRYRETALRLWLKISPLPHVAPGEIETYGGQPNKQAADMVTTFDPGRMIWHGYTGAAGWMLRQAIEGVLGLRLVRGEIVRPGSESEPRLINITRNSPVQEEASLPQHNGHKEASSMRPNVFTRLFLCVLCGLVMSSLSSAQLPPVVPPQSAPMPFRFPTVPAHHKHVRALLENAMRYVAPANKITDPVSGYPYEGWNQDPKKGWHLRTFTQLTAIGLWMELLADIAAGAADTPLMSRDNALTDLAHVVRTLRQDQRDLQLGSKGLLGNFLDLSTGKRLGPLTADVERQRFTEEFGREKGEAIWNALATRGWIKPRNDGTEAGVVRTEKFGWNHFDGPLAPYADEATKRKVMAILDQRVITIVFVDNANLSASAAKTIGALLRPEVKDRPGVAELRQELEQFLEDQRAGYEFLYDRKVGLFYFGWDATKDRLFGWVNLQGKWVTGHVDYLVNEFRGPATFIVVRYGLPVDAIKNLGFKIKRYSMRDGRDVYALAPWEGSAFQALGLGLWLNELASPSWRTLWTNAVDIEIDYATRHRLPGFLSESYTGVGTQYTGAVGIPEITVSPNPRVTDAASLYTLGVAYAVAPEKIEQFLAANWPIISRLLTNHGPWEGFNVTRQEPITYETTAHTLSLILGILNTGSEHKTRYLDSRGLTPRLAEIFRPGKAVDLFAAEVNMFAWAPKGQTIRSVRENTSFRVTGERINDVGIAFVSTRPQGVNVSGGVLSIRYRCTGAGSATIDLKPPTPPPPESNLIPSQIFARFADTGGQERELEITLPATPGLKEVKEVVITFAPEQAPRGVDLAITQMRVTPAR